jgi:hypothetical protein
LETAPERHLQGRKQRGSKQMNLANEQKRVKTEKKSNWVCLITMPVFDRLITII